MYISIVYWPTWQGDSVRAKVGKDSSTMEQMGNWAERTEKKKYASVLQIVLWHTLTFPISRSGWKYGMIVNQQVSNFKPLSG